MRVLWFTNTPSCYQAQQSGYNGGGWITSAEMAVRQRDDIQLAVSFMLDGQPFKVEQNGTTYYPIAAVETKREKIVRRLVCDSEKRQRMLWPRYIAAFMKIIDDFKPDIIQVFGSEEFFGLVAAHTDVPVVLHIQGILNPYLNAFLPPAMSWHDYERSLPLKTRLKELITGSTRSHWQVSCYREREILRHVKYYMGRTDWDRRVTSIMSPRSQYFYCSEILRDIFYTSTDRRIPDRLTIVTTISSPPYKGIDTVLKTAAMLKHHLQLDFEWKVFGNIDPTAAERRYGIRCNDVNVRLMGVASARELLDHEQTATLYVHTSYIDNSPNSLCEAQMAGLPCISANVGGVSSLIDDGRTGFLVPANDPYQLAYLINRLHTDRELNAGIGRQAREAARKRHDKDAIIDSIIHTYKEILKQKQ